MTPVSRLGGLEMYVNGEMVGRTLIPVTENKGGSTKFNPIKTFKINGKEPPVIIYLEKKCKINIKKDLTIFFLKKNHEFTKKKYH